MQSEDVKQLIESHLPGSEVHARGADGKYEVIVISDRFDALNAVKRQQLVYGAVNDNIADGSIHAITIKAYTPSQWQEQS